METQNVPNLPRQQPNDRIKLNVGGKLFETTISTLQTSAPDSLLAALSSRTHNQDPETPIFIDRDPEIFSVILSFLRSNRLPSTARRFSKQELAEEALYYGVDAELKAAMLPPPLSGIDALLIDTIRPTSDGFPSAFTAGAGDGSVWIAHGGQISSYDWNLTHTGTVRTHVDEITAIRRVWGEVAAVASDNGAGLHFYDFSSGRHVGSAHWTDSSDVRIYKARVVAVTDSSDSVFASFDVPHRENCILRIDKSTLQIVGEIGRQTASATKTMVPGKLTYVPESGMIVGSSVSSGAFGFSGYIRIWDPRLREVIWEVNEPGSGRSSRFGDSFADVDVDVDESAMFKVCSKSGDVAMADLRKLKDDPWVYLEEKNPSLRNSGGGENSMIHCYRKQVFVTRDRGLEVWSRVREREDEEELRESRSLRGSSYRKNYVDKAEDYNGERGMIRKMEGGGDRLFVSRDGVEGIEVWESSNLSGAVSVL
ncbi:hypothetical protein GIB67_027398 [Kingdonia uniflora]|uniref:BTB domain-containing protein n=1 Tax=Kingdonia uniflora TaxID=39325 RepID=A0A7J7MF82_9MAGN|nr:hypothetical protein GIB67_027398 [Kingdonia uniflora]